TRSSMSSRGTMMMSGKRPGEQGARTSDAGIRGGKTGLRVSVRLAGSAVGSGGCLPQRNPQAERIQGGGLRCHEGDVWTALSDRGQGLPWSAQAKQAAHQAVRARRGGRGEGARHDRGLLGAHRRDAGTWEVFVEPLLQREL